MSSLAHESRAERQKVLEERKRRIAELREARSRRSEDTARVQASATANLEDFVSEILAEPPPVPVPRLVDERDEETKANNVPSDHPEQLQQPMPPPVVASIPPPPPKKQAEIFSVGTQTEDDDFVELQPKADDEFLAEEDGENKNEVKPPPIETSPDLDNAPRLLNPQQLEKEVGSQTFTSFLNTASKKVERMLGTILPLQDPVLESASSDTVSADIESKNVGQFISSQKVYSCPKWTQNRDITDTDWSPLQRDLFLTTYSQNTGIHAGSQTMARHADTPSDSLTPRSGELQADGLVCIWSSSMPQRPEHVLTTGSPVTAGRFHPTDAPLVVGGCASGQVVVWDVRAGRLPVQKSAPVAVSTGTKGHLHAVNAMHVLEGGAGFVTTSTDGKVNIWSLANLRDPQESLQIGDSVSCLAVAPASGTLILGDDQGALYSVAAGAVGQRRKQSAVRKLEHGHYGMVTAISTQSTKANDVGLHKGFLRGLGGFVLSAGVDWTVQLWAPAFSEKPITSWVNHNYDYMAAVEWSPVHPSIFATASSSGTIALWNLALSQEDPIIETSIGREHCNGLKFSLDGRRIAVATHDELVLLNLTDQVLRTSKQDEDGKTAMHHFYARGWISK